MIYQFACFEINTFNKQLCIQGNVIEADERLTELLMELVRHYPNHCTKTALLEVLWPDTVVSDWSISKLVSDARQMFKQHGINDEVIQTLHGRGYRLSSHLGDQIVEVEPAPVTAIPKPQHQNAKRIKTVLLTLSIFITIMVFYYANSPSQPLQKSEPANSIGRLLWVDDNPDNNKAEKAYFEKHKITVYQVKSTDEALTSLQLYEFKMIISDMGRGEEVLAGLNLLKELRNNNNPTPFVMYTIVLTQAQQTILDKYQGQGVAVEADKLYQLVLPFFEIPAEQPPIKNINL